jgi:predicted flap endonuclease-1-like 5' DNA nuclease
MLAKAVFIAVLILFSVISFFIDLPPGIVVTEQMNLSPEFRFLTNNLVNGIVFGAIIAAVVFLVRRQSKPKYTPKTVSKSADSALDEIDGMLAQSSKMKFESDLKEIPGIGSKRALELEMAGVKTIADLAKRSPKHLAEKTGIPISQISKWIVEANKLQKS